MNPSTEKPETPWKKRRKGPQQFMPPSRALYGERDGVKGTSTWAYYGSRNWKCISASGCLHWMRDSTEPQFMVANLMAQQTSWYWIEPNTVGVLEPPF